MAEYFGTDGVRGVANKELTPELALELGKSGGKTLKKQAVSASKSGESPAVIVGRDTRLSGDMFLGALGAGLNSIGVNIIDLGIVPTPAVAYLASTQSTVGGIMISASHNPVADNGIKFFNASGYKLTDALEKDIEKNMKRELKRAEHPHIGQYYENRKLIEKYIENIKNAIPVKPAGLEVIVDCAYGAAYELAPHIFKSMGVDITAVNDEARGDRINHKCGATNIGFIKEKVANSEADLGIALDGDSDRCILVDEEGNEIDGDHIMCICGLHMMNQNKLNKKKIVTTRYSNLGLKEAINRAGGEIELADNGDKYVLNKMREQNLSLGGEKSGHIIFLDHNTSGDGILTALKVMSVMVEEEKSLKELAQKFTPWPQILTNVRVEKKREWSNNKNIKNTIKKAEKNLDEGRVFVRASGTEPVIRVMLEGKERKKLNKWKIKLENIIKTELN